MNEQIPSTTGTAGLASLPVTIEHTDHSVLAILHLAERKTIAIRFDSPELLLDFCVGLMNEGAELWPNHEAFKEYTAPEEEK